MSRRSNATAHGRKQAITTARRRRPITRYWRRHATSLAKPERHAQAVVDTVSIYASEALESSRLRRYLCTITTASEARAQTGTSICNKAAA
eukprot:6186587-Pleurochrysis_carterae.AAC.2